MTSAYSNIDRQPLSTYLEDMKTALSKVKKIYYHWTLHTESTTDEKTSYCERVFAYELYHQLRVIMEDDPNYKNLYLNGEPIKNNHYFTTLFDNIDKEYFNCNERNFDKTYPDLVLHEDPGTISPNGQIYLVEIKMEENPMALSDLKKLTLLERSKLNYQAYIFIYIGNDINSLKDKIKKSKNTEISNNIICFFYDFNSVEYGTIDCFNK